MEWTTGTRRYFTMRGIIVVVLGVILSTGCTTSSAETSTNARPPALEAPIAIVHVPIGLAQPEKPAQPVELTAAAEAGWRHALETARNDQIKRLRAYRKRGVFPTFNTGFGSRETRTDPRKGPLRHQHLGAQSPVFIDDLGTHCAVAYLMRESGWGDVVDEVAATNNYVYINDIAEGPVLEWIALSGLTKDEAAEIQPGYETQWDIDQQQRFDDQWELQDHFRRMERKLARTTKRSIDAIMEQLRPRIAAGLSISSVGATWPQS